MHITFVIDLSCVSLAIIASPYFNNSPQLLFGVHSFPTSVTGVGMRVPDLAPEEDHGKHERGLRQLMYSILLVIPSGDGQTHDS